VGDSVTFAGGVPFERVLDFYEQSDVLVLVSESEGWPKAIVEGMAFGLVCIGSERGLIPQILSDGRGEVVPPGDAAALAEVLRRIVRNPEAYADTRGRAAAWARPYSLEGLREALRDLLTERWGVAFSRTPPTVRGNVEALPV
jgi:glycosyltransferase involved in cell wall biosynthesis